MTDREYKPTLAQLRTFVTIADSKHFGMAAGKLGISQPSLSQALVALETGLQIPLIERSTRKVIVTANGEALLPYAKATLEAAEAFVTQSRDTSGLLGGPLALGLIPTLAPYILPDLLRYAQSLYPELQSTIVEENTAALVSQLRTGHINATLLTLPTGYSGLTEIELFRENLVIVTPENHPLAGRRGLSLDVLADLDLLLLNEGHCLRDQIIDLCRSAQVIASSSSETATRASSLATIVRLVAAGFGSTLVPESALETECAIPGLGFATFDESVVAERTIGLVCRATSTIPVEHEEIVRLVRRSHSDVVDRGRQLLSD